MTLAQELKKEYADNCGKYPAKVKLAETKIQIAKQLYSEELKWQKMLINAEFDDYDIEERIHFLTKELDILGK